MVQCTLPAGRLLPATGQLSKLVSMDVPPLQAKSSWRPGRVSVRLGAEHRRAYEVLYSQYRPIFDSLPTLRERDFDGGTVSMTKARFEALNRAFASLATPPQPATDGPFAGQERTKLQLSKRLQHLS